MQLCKLRFTFHNICNTYSNYNRRLREHEFNVWKANNDTGIKNEENQSSLKKLSQLIVQQFSCIAQNIIKSQVFVAYYEVFIIYGQLDTYKHPSS